MSHYRERYYNISEVKIEYEIFLLTFKILHIVYNANSYLFSFRWFFYNSLLIHAVAFGADQQIVTAFYCTILIPE